MRIPGIERLFSIVNAKVRKADASAQTQSKQAARPDKVEISERAQKVKAAHFDTIDQTERAKYVAEIKERVENGEYEIDADKIARELVKNDFFDGAAGE